MLTFFLTDEDIYLYLNRSPIKTTFIAISMTTIKTTNLKNPTWRFPCIL